MSVRTFTFSFAIASLQFSHSVGGVSSYFRGVRFVAKIERLVSESAVATCEHDARDLLQWTFTLGVCGGGQVSENEMPGVCCVAAHLSIQHLRINKTEVKITHTVYL